MYHPPSISTEEVALRLVLALALGAVIGLEREWRDRTAGLRTHMLVCLGSAAFTIISAYAFSEYYTRLPDGTRVIADPARIAAQIVSGIGFLGAGAIFQSRGNVRGLTTAASLWMMAAIGMAAGAGEYAVAIISTVLIGLVLVAFRQFSRRINRMRAKTRATIEVNVSRADGYKALFDTLDSHNVLVTRVATGPPSEEGADRSLAVDISLPPQEAINAMTTDLLAARGIVSVVVEDRP